MLKKQESYDRIVLMRAVFLIIMTVIGAAMGSFLGCQAWRLRYKDTRKKDLGRWSVCLHCKKRLKWYDNIPILSWLLLGGKCRYCKKKIGCMEIIIEVLGAFSFWGTVSMFDFTAAGVLGWINFVIQLLFLMSLMFLAVYDGMWGELPNFVLIIAGILAAVLASIGLVTNGFSWGIIANMAGAVGILGGLYLVLYLISKGAWVGNGDWILGSILAVVLADAWLALILLSIANISGALVALPKIKKEKKQKIYFGPFLVLAFVVVWTFANFFKGLISF